jgi:hypothetical protein
LTQIGEGTAPPFGFAGPLEPGSVEVTVVERKSGEPVAGVGITLRGPNPVSSVTGPDGRARFADLAPGPYRVQASQPEFLTGYGTDSVIVEPGQPAALSLRVKRVFLSVTVKRDRIKGLYKVLLGDKQGADYGHWWIDIDGTESYGWWPSVGVPGLRALMGVPGQLNGMLLAPGSPTRDLHHDDDGDEEFHPVVINGNPAAVIKECIRTFAWGYSGGWSWPWGQNCHSFQEELMEHCGLTEHGDEPKSSSRGGIRE